jgi:hypothetical protein
VSYDISLEADLGGREPATVFDSWKLYVELRAYLLPPAVLVEPVLAVWPGRTEAADVDRGIL